MQLVLIHQYLVGIAGLVAGAVVGALVVRVTSRGRMRARDARLTAPLLLAAATAHVFLIPAVELERQLLFGLYGLGVLGTVAVGLAGFLIWRLGAVLLPAGSILGYFYFAVLAHQVDYAGLAIKIVEALAIGSGLSSTIVFRRSGRSVHVAGA